MQLFVIQDHESCNSVNSILSCSLQSPIISKIATLLEDRTPSVIYRMTAKLRRAVAAATNTIVNSIAPGQGESLVNLTSLKTVFTSQNSPHPHRANLDEAFLDHLVQTYEAYESRNVPNNEKIRLLTLIPNSLDLSYEDIWKKLQCTNYAIETARALRMASETPIHTDAREWVILYSFRLSTRGLFICRAITRQRRHPKRINHFLSGLIDLTLLVPVFWGSTRITLISPPGLCADHTRKSTFAI